MAAGFRIVRGDCPQAPAQRAWNMTERDIFSTAAELASENERHAFLNDVCGRDVTLRERIELLLSDQAELGSFLETPSPLCAPTAAMTESGLTESPGAVIGSYKLLEQLGEGGFGVVFMAEQKSPVKRMVALKVTASGEFTVMRLVDQIDRTTEGTLKGTISSVGSNKH
jgi:serine/threonine protein kinase